MLQLLSTMTRASVSKRLRGFLAAASTLMFAAMGSTAHAQTAESLVSSFDQVCLQGGIDRPDQKQAMVSAGWMPLPTAFLQQIVGSMPLRNVEGFIVSTHESAMIGMLAEMTIEGQSVAVCATSMIPKASDLRAALVEWAGVSPAPTPTSGTDTMIALRVDGSTATPVTATPAEMQRLMTSGQLIMVAGREYPTMTMIMTMRF